MIKKDIHELEKILKRNKPIKSTTDFELWKDIVEDILVFCRSYKKFDEKKFLEFIEIE